MFQRLLRHSNATLLLTALCVVVMAVFFGQFEFGAYDPSLMVDVAWRQHLGQHPYVDFPCMLPPAFYLLAGAAFHLFGVHWVAFTLINALLYSVLLCLGWFALRLAAVQDAADWLRLLLVFSLSIPVLVSGHLWHSSMPAMLAATELFLLYVLTRDLDVGREHWFAVAALVPVQAALVLSKPNTALPALLAPMFFVVFSKQRKKLLLRCAAAFAAALALATVTLATQSVTLSTVFRSYLQVSNRPTVYYQLRVPLPPAHIPFPENAISFGTLDAGPSYLAVCIALCVVVLWFRNRHLLPAPAVAAVCSACMVSVAGFCTDWDTRLDDVAPVAFATALALVLLSKGLPGRASRAAAFLLPRFVVGLAMVSLIFCTARARMVTTDEWAGPKYGEMVLRRSTPFFGSFHGREKFWQVCDQVDAALRAHPGSKIYFAERMEFNYARTGTPSPRGLPLWWHPGSSYPIVDQAIYVERWKAARFDLVFAASMQNDGYDRIPPGIMDSLGKDYVRISPQGSNVDIYQRRTGT